MKTRTGARLLTFGFVLSAVLLAVTSLPVLAQTPAKPNIIILLADDLGWGDVGYHGSDIRTPNIDRLAKEGIEMNRYYTAAVCSPTRAGLLTGRYPDRFGLRASVIPPWSTFGVSMEETYFPQYLAQAGYKHRAVIGKWHLGHADLKYHPLNRGFTHFYGHLNGAIDYFTHEREGELDWHNDFEPSYDKGYSTDLLADEAIRSIKRYNGAAPFFIYVAFNAPHGPLQAKETDLLAYGYDKTKPLFANPGKEGNVGSGNTARQTYSAMVSNMDANIGRILQVLKDLKIDDNTLVLFHSDNGAAPGEGSSAGDLRGTKFTEWEGGVRAPAIIKWPAAFKGGSKSEQVTGFIDIAPTFLEIAGYTGNVNKPFDGISMLPVWSGKKRSIARDLYLGPGTITNAAWKLVGAVGKNPRMKDVARDLFFHIAADPGEQKPSTNADTAEFNRLKAAAAQFDAIKSKEEVGEFGAGRKGFIAPKQWTIKK